MSETFAKSARLLTPGQFKRVFSRSRRVQDSLFIVRVRYAAQDHPRLGLAISKRHARMAVQRNRIKRCVREAFRHLADTLRAGDYVVINAPQAARASKTDLHRSIATLLVLVGKKTAGSQPD
ncbi:MAG: ribonuclease P protein component [Pseudomonadota bacterium]